MSENIELLSQWVGSVREDIGTLKKVLECEKANNVARKYAAAALNYLVSRMDLIPDWTPTIGVVDDVLVLRIYAELASAEGLDDLDHNSVIAIGRLTNDAERVAEILGEDLYAKLRKFATRTSEDVVRGRRAGTIVSDATVRKELYKEVEEELLRMPAAAFQGVDNVEGKLQSYLHAKLKAL